MAVLALTVFAALYATLQEDGHSVAADVLDSRVSTPEADRLAALEAPVATPGPQAIVSAFAATSPEPPSAPLDLVALVLDACEPAPSDLYCVYSVLPGDTLSSIAIKFGLEPSGEISPAQLLAESNRPDVIDPNTIVPGQKLRIPSQVGVIHTVITPETLSEVAASYGVTAEAVRSLAANALGNEASMAIGRVLLIPEPDVLPKAAGSSGADDAEEPEEQATPTPTTAVSTPVTAASTPTPMATSQPAQAAPTRTTTRTPSPTPSPKASPTQRPSTRGPGFIWPATGPISSYFGPSHPLGIDIDLYADGDEPIKAAAAGTVTFAGGDPCCSYGYYVIIEHTDGFTTLYAHLSRFSVKAGDRVRRGETIGRGGRTGYATGNHLHFEVRRDGKVLDPLRYLP